MLDFQRIYITKTQMLAQEHSFKTKWHSQFPNYSVGIWVLLLLLVNQHFPMGCIS